jgi:uncharacterized protein (TIGR03437 family)
VGVSRPQIAGGSLGIVNANDGTRNIRPGSFILINGVNLADSAATDEFSPPTVLGGSCVTFSNLQLPIVRTNANQILAQVPEDAPSGSYVAVVRSLATGQRSDPVVVSLQ